MPFDWMSQGPGQLDLATPLMEGEKTGTAMAEQQERVRSDYANEQRMSEALGLQAKHESFEESMWNSQADARAAQLDITKNTAAEGAMKLGFTADDHQALTDWQAQADKAAANNDFDNIPPIPTLNTTEARQAADQHLNSLWNTGAGIAASQNKFARSAVLKSSIDVQTEAIKAGVQPVLNADGSMDVQATARAVVAQSQSDKAVDATNSAKVLAAQMAANASMYKADTTTTNTKINAAERAGANQNSVQGRTLNRLYQSRDDAMKNGEPTDYWDGQIRALGGKIPTSATSDAPPVNPQQAAIDYSKTFQVTPASP